MHTTRRLAVASATIAGTLAWFGTPPAGAAVVPTTTGTTVTVVVTGAETVTFACVGVVLLVNGTPAAPSAPCATLTKVTVNGDGANQVIDGQGLDAAAFAAGPTLTANGGAGNDTLTGTARSDSLNGGNGSDLAIIPVGPAADAIGLAGNEPFEDNKLRVLGTFGDDSILIGDDVSSIFGQTFIRTKVVWTGPGGTSTTLASGVRNVEVNGGSGNDSLRATATRPTSITGFTANGGDGDDTLDGAGAPNVWLLGGSGANALIGTAGADTIASQSHLDQIDGKGGYDRIYDQDGERAGGRTRSVDPNGEAYYLRPTGDVGTVRLRPSAGSPTVGAFTSSGNRTGQGSLEGITDLAIAQAAEAGPTDLTLSDLVLVPGLGTAVYGIPGRQDLADITVPYGEWTRHDELGMTIVMPTDPTLQTVTLQNQDEVSVHGPWTDADEGFVHRIVRDTLYTFIDEQGRTERADALKAGTLTRAGFVDQILADDWSIGYDVDRAFLKFLRRGADPSGKAYWINSIGTGKALWRFRAQLFGSNEYFTKAGGTNASYVTKAYTDVLGRAPDPSGQTYWTNKLDNGADRGSVALQFINSPEARRRLVDDQFLRFLDRLPTTAESNQWVAALPSAGGEQQLVRTLATSTEYYERA